MIKTYFTFLMISYFVQGEELKTSILLPSFDDCSYSIQHMSDILEPYGKDAAVVTKLLILFTSSVKRLCETNAKTVVYFLSIIDFGFLCDKT